MEPIWKYLVSGSVFTLSMLIGHFTVQGSTNVFFRVAVACGWLALIAVSGAGEFWLMNAMALMWFWTIHLTYREFWTKRKLEDDPNPLFGKPRVYKLVACCIVFLATLIASLALGLRQQWCWSKLNSYSSEYDAFLAGVIFPIVFPWLYYLQVAAFSSRRNGWRRIVWLAGAAVAGFMTIEVSRELLGMLESKDPPLSVFTYVCFLGTFALIFFRGRSAAVSIGSLLAVMVILVVSGVFFTQLTSARFATFDRPNSIGVTGLTMSRIQQGVSSDIETNLDQWNDDVLKIVQAWARPLAETNGTRLKQQLAQLEQRDDAISSLDLQALVRHRYYQGSWQSVVDDLLGQSWIEDVFQIVETYRLRYLVFNRMNRIRLASRMVTLETDTSPGSMEELREASSFEVPADPFSGRDFRQQVDKNSWSVYSIGEDKTDDDGAALTIVGVKRVFDFVLDRWSGDIALQIKPDVQQ